MKHKLLPTLTLLLLISLLPACNSDFGEPHTSSWTPVDPNEYFDFNTLTDVSVNIQFDAATYVAIFDTDIVDANGNPRLLHKCFTDDSGLYSAEVEVPKACVGHKLMAVADGYRVTAPLSSRGVKFAAHYDSRANSRAGASRASRVEMPVHDQILKWCTEVDGLYKDRFPEGKDNRTKIEDKNDLCLNVINGETELKFSFVHSGGRYMSRVFYYYYDEDNDIRNDERMNSVDKLYDFFVTKQADPTRYLLTRNWGCIYTNTDQDQQSGWVSDTQLTGDANSEVPDWVKQQSHYTPNRYYGNGYINRNFNNQVGASNDLMYYGRNYDEPGTTVFPPNIRIGFLLDVIPLDGYNMFFSDCKTNPQHRILLCTHKMLNRSPLYYNRKVTDYGDKVGNYGNNPGYVDEGYRNKQCGRALKALDIRDDGTVSDEIVNIIYGFEDAINHTNPDNFTPKDLSDLDFNDMIFMITATPKVSTANIPVVGKGAAINGGTLMFEYLYPNAGDYDMNDVIVEYEFVKKFNVNNELTELTYRFWPMHYGASYDDDFYFTSSVTGKSPSEAVRVFTAAQLREGARINEAVVARMIDLPYMVERTIAIDPKVQKIMSNDFNKSDFNPFIFVHNTGHEVHMVNDKFVGVDGAVEITAPKELRNYYPMRYDMDGTYFPFAMNIPLRYTDSSYTRFRPVKESVRIEKEYARFLDWMVSNGQEYMEWYFYYSGALEW